MSTFAAGGYALPPTTTGGVQVHHWSSGTPESAEGMWLPHPRHDLLAAGRDFYYHWLVRSCRCYIYITCSFFPPTELGELDYVYLNTYSAHIHICAVQGGSLIVALTAGGTGCAVAHLELEPGWINLVVTPAKLLID